MSTPESMMEGLLTGDQPIEEVVGTDGEGDAPPEMYLRDLTEDHVYERLQQAGEFGETLRATEDRLHGSSQELANRLAAIEKGLPTQAVFNMEMLAKGLADYDPKLAEVLPALMQEALQVNALNEETLRPFLEPIQKQNAASIGEQLVMSAYTPEALAEILPPVENGRFAPKGQRHEDFAAWFNKQGFETQQSLQTLGAPYLHSIRRFEAYEKELLKERADAAASKATRLKSGVQPSSQDRRAPGVKPLTDAEAFEAGFKEVMGG